ncbi:hypothetical protein AALO_G00145250 [Alosa alosa]|uniref:Uncharacterized protein n=1 Tax=Alosa alosa TaxID=278164 RepID=A0AAV6GNR7_9TELE|nr:uncharacterized protein C3orf14 homolog [Alosa sapidissima]XP_048111067.1 uncharacterized protein C3orf14 homolog [Alosa alosa]KAG5275247.1 hypothetical protein AALO_G00145250 [Alosa alosa]
MYDESELSKKHEDILGKRAELLEQMEIQYQHQKVKKKQQSTMSKAAQERNAQLLGDIKTLEDKLRMKQPLHPDVLTLETCYWASMEENLPEWEPFLLGRGPAPGHRRAWSPGRRRQENTGVPRDTQDRGLPPRPRKPRAV